jgi:glutaredoxin
MKKLVVALTLLLAGTQAMALYKVVGPDGKVTYTDRPPVDTGSKVVPYGSARQAGAADVAVLLPIDLRQVAARFPVTLYTSVDCPPCDSARTLLQQRGVPYIEKRVQSDDDVQAVERLTGGRIVPSATIGAQQLRGLNVADWTGYLDAAGYPKESRLPRGWQPPAVTPVVAARQPAATPAPAAPPAAPAPTPDDASTPTPGTIKF